jgi:hypothetical protein
MFGIVAAVEIHFIRRIQFRWTESEWTTFLSPGRLEKARQVQTERERRGERCALLHCLQLSDKAQILINDPAELSQLGFESKSAALRGAGNLERLRNNLAHSQPIVDTLWTQIANLALRAETILSGFALPARADSEAEIDRRMTE